MTRALTSVLLYVGTYTGGDSKGIYVCRFNLQTGALQATDLVAETKNPSFLVVSPDGRYLYSVCETFDFRGKPSGGVSAFAVDPVTGGLTLLNERLSQGTGPCHVAVTADGRYVLVANYGSGSAALFPVADDGRLGEVSAVVRHEGAGVNPKRQKGPHAHSVTLSPDNRYAFVCDLGIDKIVGYKLDAAAGKLVPAGLPDVEAAPGAGPRHMAFHPTGRYAYVINELNATIAAYAYQPETGTLTRQQTVPTLPPGFPGDNLCADIHVHPSGRFLYGSNRGHDSIVLYAIDKDTGKLTSVGQQPTLGGHPRNFTLDPTGTFLLVANRDSDNVVTFRVDTNTGGLTPTGQVLTVPQPTCLQFRTGTP